MDTQTVLTRTRELLGAPEAWCRSHCSLDDDDVPLLPADPSARCWDLLGAVEHIIVRDDGIPTPTADDPDNDHILERPEHAGIAGALSAALDDMLESHIHSDAERAHIRCQANKDETRLNGITAFNDAEGTGHADVLRLLETAIDAAPQPATRIAGSKRR